MTVRPISVPSFAPFGLAILAIGAGVLCPLPAARAALVIPAVLLAPGYGVVAALFGRHRLDVAPALCLSAMLSMAMLPLLALALSALGLPITTRTILVAVDATIVALALCGAARAWAGIRPQSAFAPPCGGRPVRGSLWSGGAAGPLFAVLGAATLGVLVAAMRLLPSAPPTPYTQLSLGGTWAGLGHTVLAAPGAVVAIPIQLANRTGQARRYRLRAALDGGGRWADLSIGLDAGASWSGTVRGGVPGDGCPHRLHISLDGGDTLPEPLTLWLQGARGNQAARCAKALSLNAR